MRDILAEENRLLLSHIASSNTLLAFDYDGTLAPIVSDPEHAELRQTTRELLQSVANGYPCVVISGRSQQDLERHMRGICVFELIGDHGFDTGDRPSSNAESVKRGMAALKRDLVEEKDIVIEDRPFSLAVHYRRSPSRRRTRAAILRAASAVEDVRVVDGKCVINVMPRDAPHKGTALSRARKRFGSDLAVYVGDDETDEDVFGLSDREWLVAVRVRPKRTSRAAYYVQDQKSVDVLLATLVQLRRESWTTDASRGAVRLLDSMRSSGNRL